MKWFTYCSNYNTVDKEANKWRTNAVHRKSPRYGYRLGRVAFGLLLHSDDEADPITNDDVTSMLRNETLEQLFPKGYFVMPADSEGDLIISASDGFSILPDAADLDTPLLQIVHQDEIQTVNLRQRYNACRSLIKAMGCEHCPEKGIACLKRSLPGDHGPIALEHDDRSDDEEAKKILKNRKTKIGAFTYISPKLTIPENNTFVPSFRHADDHDFSQININSEKISSGVKKAADGRQFKKKHCSGCALRPECNSYRSCVGPYGSDEKIAKHVLASYESKLKEGPFEPWQFWAIARGGGSEGMWRRKNVVLHGLRHTSYGWVAEVWRRKTDLSSLTTFTNYEALRDVFHSLPDEKRVKERPDYWTQPDNDVITALYLRLTEHSRSNRHRGGWGGNYYGLLYKALENNEVTVQFSGPGYTRHRIRVATFAHFYGEIDYHIGAPQDIVRIGAYRNG